jgi:MoxR-like ATPase
VGPELESIDAIQQSLYQNTYVADRALATAIFLTLKLNKPLLLEGEAGVGKTQVAKTLAEMLKRPLIRLQLRRAGLNSTIYEWNYTPDAPHPCARLCKAVMIQPSWSDLFGPELYQAPALQAIESTQDGTAQCC